MFKKQSKSIRNLVQLNVYDKPFHPEISGIREMLFENMSPLTAHTIARKVEDVINNFEPEFVGKCSCVSRFRS